MRPLVYTQTSVAFPILLPRDRELESIDVQGLASSIQLEWIKLGPSWPIGALQIRAFTDALPTLLDPRIQRVLDRIRRRRKSDEVDAATVVSWLEKEGAIPSIYHLRGLDTGNLSMADKAVLQKRIEIARRYE